LQCIGANPPDGFVLVGGDCAPADKNRYYAAPYSFVDRDGDGATVPEQGTYCGDGSLVPPYLTAATWLDCDDADKDRDHYAAMWADGDGDGFGAGRALAVCRGKAQPPGYSPYGTDMDDGNKSITEDPNDDDGEILDFD
jgi:hypothetical protein